MKLKKAMKLCKTIQWLQPKALALVFGVSCLLLLCFLASNSTSENIDDWDKIQDDNFTVVDEMWLCFSSAKILHRAENLRKGVPKESICRLRVPKSIYYEIDGDIRVDGNSSSIFWVNSQGKESLKVKPFPRNCDPLVMKDIKEYSVKSFPLQNESVPQCTSNHSYPAVLFAYGGYTVNFYHDFTDLLIPLFLTAHRYHGEVQFLITNMKPSWVERFSMVLKNLTRYEIIDIDKVGHSNIHCYKSMTIGLYAHGEFSIDPLMPPLGYTFAKFTDFLQRSFSLERHMLRKHEKSPPRKPKLLLITRRWTRKLINANETATMASDLGFEVIVMDAGDETVDKFAQTVNSCDVLVAVHGAALTNMIFLPQDAVLLQIIPWGRMEGLSWCDYGFPAMHANLKYLEYQASLEESTLLDKYPRDHRYIQDPFSVHMKGWFVLNKVYMSYQDVILDLQRFRGTLVEALEHVKKYR
ncbi:hypothetical protein LUZ63_014009 [Rhynchospora breviuscula]|uniref:Glycosyltransferase 61 catalytic domain-containing protein n=1 Tax=Rhynchospora breviuscula TaxID=2022672 RepID=A0A9Q0CA35_9POAL|nr:hypothetical protein LUZ63_014009 [Rhynchospora breviuscula]